MEAELDPGFDVSRAIENLHRTALDLGAKPSSGCDPQNAYDLAMQHILQHGFQHEAVDGLHSQVAGRCRVSPCQLAGVCYSLQELLQWKREVTAPRSRAIIAVAHAARECHEAMEAQLARFAIVARELIRSSDMHHELEDRHHVPGQFHKHELTCVAPQEAINDSESALARFDRLANELPAMIESPELAQPPARKRTALLHSAVCQHLRWGGWSYADIADLVPDGLGGNREDRVRKRVKSGDARSLLPVDELERILPAARSM